VIRTPAMSSGRRAACALLCASLLARSAWGEVLNRIVATVDGEPITAREVERYGEERRATGVSSHDVLEALITDKLLAKEIDARKITAKPDDIDRYVAEIKERGHMDDATFAAALKQQGMTVEQYRARVKEEIEKTELVNQEIRSRVNVSKGEVERYFKEHPDEFTNHAGGITVRDIFFAVRPGMSEKDIDGLVAKATEVKRLVAGGTRFEELARKYSEGPGADQGGLLGTFKKGEMAPSLERVAFALRPGEVSDPVVTPGGVHLLQVDSVAGGDGGAASLDDVKEQIHESLYNQALEQRFRDWISKDLRERHHVEVLN
jgi:peptidyl-prolyl cis-trans isomerase SurA